MSVQYAVGWSVMDLTGHPSITTLPTSVDSVKSVGVNDYISVFISRDGTLTCSTAGRTYLCVALPHHALSTSPRSTSHSTHASPSAAMAPKRKQPPSGAARSAKCSHAATTLSIDQADELELSASQDSDTTQSSRSSTPSSAASSSSTAASSASAASPSPSSSPSASPSFSP